jgi:hypothetical protein
MARVAGLTLEAGMRSLVRIMRSLAAVVILAVGLAVGLGVAAGPAGAADPPPDTPAPKGTDADEAEARRVFRRGQAHYNLSEYAQAAEDFESAYRLYPLPVFLYNAAQALRLAGSDERALYFYRVYLRVEPKSKMRGEVQERIAALEKALQSGATTKPEGARPAPAPPSIPPPAATPPPSATPAAPAAATPTTPPASPPPATGTSPPATPAASPAATGTSPAPGASPPAEGSAATPAATATSSSTVSARPSGKTPVYKKWWLWTIVGVVVVGVAVGASVGATVGGSNGPPAIRF